MAYVIGKLEGRISGGKISGEIRDLVLHEGPRPKTAYEFGADPTQIERLNSRTPGSINTLVRLGVGCALVARGVENLTWLDERQMEKFKEKVGELNGAALLGARRNIQASGSWLCQDICAGVLDEKNIVAGAIRELVEVGLYNSVGWGQYVLGDVNLKPYQDILDEEQKKVWRLVNSDFESSSKIDINLVSFAQDKINGIPCCVSGEPDTGGSLEFILICKTILKEPGWLFRDLETGINADGKEFLLNRQALAIIPRPAATLIQIGFGLNGVDLDYPIIVLEGENLALNTNQKVQRVLRNLRWIQGMQE